MSNPDGGRHGTVRDSDSFFSPQGRSYPRFVPSRFIPHSHCISFRNRQTTVTLSPKVDLVGFSHFSSVIRKEDASLAPGIRFVNQTVMHSRSMRLLILVLLVLTFSPFDMGNDYCLIFQFEKGAALESEISGMTGKYRCDSHHHCICLLCIATAESTNTAVISRPKEAEELDPISLISIASPFYLKVFRPPRA